MRRLIGIVMVNFLCFGYGWAELIKLDMSKEEVKRILGEPDMVTTREKLVALIAPRPLDPKKYKYRYEFWIYYRYPKERKLWGYVEFDKEGLVVDYYLHPKDKKPNYKVRGKSPGLDLYEKIGDFRGEDWNLMPDKSKLLLVVDIMDRLREKGIIIRKSPLYYLEELDSFFQDPAHNKFTVINVLYCLAVLNKDWDDGTDKEDRIRQLLPSDMWEDFIR